MDGYLLDLGLMDYLPAFSLQEECLEARMTGRLPSLLLMQECPRTFTIGRSGSWDNILASPEELNRLGIEVLEVNRGGDVTYHGPGQIIASPLFYLGDFNIHGNEYMHWMEDVLIKTLAEYGLQSRSRPDYPGVWVGEAKIGAVGIAVKHGYTFHGISLNVNLDLFPFQLINPCGMAAMPVTSLENELGYILPMDVVKSHFRDSLSDVFNITLHDESLLGIQARLTRDETNEIRS